MKTASLAQVLTGSITLSANHYLYRVEMQAVVFYVGKSKHPVQRVTNHILGRKSIGYDNVGQLVLCNLPDSLSWQVRFYTLADCNQATYDVFIASGALPMIYLKGRYSQAAAHKTFPNDEEAAYTVNSAIERAEAALIVKARPCLNVIMNTHERTQLPSTVIKPAAFTSLYATPALARKILRYYLQPKHEKGDITDVAA